MFIIVKDTRININNVFGYKGFNFYPSYNLPIKYDEVIYRLVFYGREDSTLVFDFDTEEERDKELKRIDDLLDKGLFTIKPLRP